MSAVTTPSDDNLRAELRRAQALNRAFVNAGRQTVQELQGWMRDHGQDLGSIEAVGALTDAIVAAETH